METRLSVFGAPRRTARQWSIIWSTGFGADFSWLHAPVFDERGRPMHTRGVAEHPGIYFVGFPWLHSRKSGIIWGVDEDGGYVASRIARALGTRP